MKIVRNTGGIKTAAENENRDADLAQISSMVDFLCILADVPIEDEAADKEGMIFGKAKDEYEAGRWSKAMLRILVQRKPQRLTVEEYEEITGEKY